MPPGGAAEDAEGTSGEGCKTVPGMGEGRVGPRQVWALGSDQKTCDAWDWGRVCPPQTTTAGLEGGGHL